MSDKLLSKEEMERLMKSKMPIGLPPIAPTRRPRDKRLGILSRDPMSPYDIPSTPAAFKNIADVMNRKQFPAYFPQSYTPVSSYFLKNNIPPFYTPGEDTDYAYGALTVAGMVELAKMGSPWRIADEKDIDVILAIAKYYRRGLSMHMSDPRISSYARDVDRLIQVVEDGQDRVYRKQGKINPGTLNIIKILKRLIVEG